MYGRIHPLTHEPTHIYYVSHIVNHSCDTSAYSTNTRTSRTARCTSFYEASFCPSVLSSSRSTQSTLSPRALAARSALLRSTIGEALTNAIVQAATASIPYIKLGPRPKPWWDQDLYTLRKAML
ncbi:hypothetical protein EJ02DRAFT_454970 [Clathrospora elynae]|uniref:Uncharacterized protein n=1 Tax=Clathrospora elynae TaxID=706981 RepID=A0A6A5SP67_9PLEO|nr:hypothetical protein EJ02DRAFT_454970 [Clathrospora elynae]